MHDLNGVFAPSLLEFIPSFKSFQSELIYASLQTGTTVSGIRQPETNVFCADIFAFAH
jgi:hypothetical protein